MNIRLLFLLMVFAMPIGYVILFNISKINPVVLKKCTKIKGLFLALLSAVVLSCGNEPDVQDPFTNGIDVQFAIFPGNVDPSSLSYELIIYESKEDWLAHQNEIFSANISDFETIEFAPRIIKSDHVYYLDIKNTGDGRFSNWNPDAIEFMYDGFLTEEKPNKYHSVKLFDSATNPFPGIYKYDSFYGSAEDILLSKWEERIPATIEIKRDFTVIITDIENGVAKTTNSRFYKRNERTGLNRDGLALNEDFVFKDKSWLRTIDNGFSYGGPDFVRGFRPIKYVLQ